MCTLESAPLRLLATEEDFPLGDLATCSAGNVTFKRTANCQLVIGRQVAAAGDGGAASGMRGVTPRSYRRTGTTEL
jgi:hypothetical protein